jgi:hypothetical protein
LSVEAFYLAEGTKLVPANKKALKIGEIAVDSPQGVSIELGVSKSFFEN